MGTMVTVKVKRRRVSSRARPRTGACIRLHGHSDVDQQPCLHRSRFKRMYQPAVANHLLAQKLGAVNLDHGSEVLRLAISGGTASLAA